MKHPIRPKRRPERQPFPSLALPYHVQARESGITCSGHPTFEDAAEQCARRNARSLFKRGVFAFRVTPNMRGYDAR